MEEQFSDDAIAGLLAALAEGKSKEELTAAIKQMYGKAKEEVGKEKIEKFNRENICIESRWVSKNSVEWMTCALRDVVQALSKHNLIISVKDGLHFDEDEDGKVRVRLTIGKK